MRVKNEFIDSGDSSSFIIIGNYSRNIFRELSREINYKRLNDNQVKLIIEYLKKTNKIKNYENKPLYLTQFIPEDSSFYDKIQEIFDNNIYLYQNIEDLDENNYDIIFEVWDDFEGYEAVYILKEHNEEE